MGSRCAREREPRLVEGAGVGGGWSRATVEGSRVIIRPLGVAG